jgi:hypothetical protein
MFIRGCDIAICLYLFYRQAYRGIVIAFKEHLLIAADTVATEKDQQAHQQKGMWFGHVQIITKLMPNCRVKFSWLE